MLRMVNGKIPSQRDELAIRFLSRLNEIFQSVEATLEPLGPGRTYNDGQSH
jgi:hypothetical protein